MEPLDFVLPALLRWVWPLEKAGLGHILGWGAPGLPYDKAALLWLGQACNILFHTGKNRRARRMTALRQLFLFGRVSEGCCYRWGYMSAPKSEVPPGRGQAPKMPSWGLGWTPASACGHRVWSGHWWQWRASCLEIVYVFISQLVFISNKKMREALMSGQKLLQRSE